MWEIDERSADRVGRAVEYHRSGRARNDKREALGGLAWLAAFGFGLGVALNWDLMWRPVLGLGALAVAAVVLYRVGTRGCRSAWFALRVAMYRRRKGRSGRTRSKVIPMRGRP